MVTALVQFKLPEPISRDKAKEIFSSTAPRYRKVAGLLRKYYLISEDGQTAGGVYLWQSQADAERLYNDEWRQFVKTKYGCEPSVVYFGCPVVVDNVVGSIITDH